jgi:hypothetical protein
MLLVRGLPIGHLERPFVRQRQDVLQQFNFGMLFQYVMPSGIPTIPD